MSEAVRGGKVLTAELSAVVRHDNIWDSMACKHTLYLVDSLCAGLLGKELHLDPSGIGDAEMTFMKMVEGVMSQASGND